jgi:DNA excision repair protein ERCC-6
MFQWVREIHAWWPQKRVAVFHATGTYECSEVSQSYFVLRLYLAFNLSMLIVTIMGVLQESFVYNMVHSQGILVTSFNNILRQRQLLLKYNWHYVILDEGHKIRNPDAQITLACKQVSTVDYVYFFWK